MKEFTIDLHDGRGNQVYVLKIDQLAALEAVVKERNLEWESIRGQNIRHATVNDELKERIAAPPAERDRLREALDTIEGMATIETVEIQKIAQKALKQTKGGTP